MPFKCSSRHCETRLISKLELLPVAVGYGGQPSSLLVHDSAVHQLTLQPD